MFHQHPLDWEVVDSYNVEPIRRTFDQQGLRLVQVAPNEIQGSYTFDMKRTTPSTSTETKRPTRSPSPSDSDSTPTSSKPRANKNAIAAPHKLKKSRPPRILVEPSSTSYPLSIICPKRRNSGDPSTSSSSPKDRSPKVDLPSPPPSRPSTTSSSTSPRLSLGFFKPQRRESASSDISMSSNSGTSDGERTNESQSRPPSPQQTYKRRSLHDTNNLPALLTPTQSSYDKREVKKVLKFARAELMKQVVAQGHNVLAVEGWKLTVLRQDTRFRIKVDYHGRGATATLPDTNVPLRLPKLPPYIEVLDR